MVMLAIAAMTSNVKGEDPTFFLVVAPIANAMWLFGSIGLAVSLKRPGEVPKVVAYGPACRCLTTTPVEECGGRITRPPRAPALRRPSR